MRTNIVIEDRLINEALKLSGFKTKKAVIENALKLFVQVKKQENIKKLRGKLKWIGKQIYLIIYWPIVLLSE